MRLFVVDIRKVRGAPSFPFKCFRHAAKSFGLFYQSETGITVGTGPWADF